MEDIEEDNKEEFEITKRDNMNNNRQSKTPQKERIEEEEEDYT